jgi:hypothetical protein
MSARQASADDAGFSFTVCRSSALREGNDARQTMTFVPWFCREACRGDVQGFGCQEALRRFQLESLILAQNERWRQA